MNAQLHIGLCHIAEAGIAIHHPYYFAQAFFNKVSAAGIDGGKLRFNFCFYGAQVAFLVTGFKQQVGEQLLVFFFKFCQAQPKKQALW